jgi:hypothetical protein
LIRVGIIYSVSTIGMSSTSTTPVVSSNSLWVF